MLIDTYPAETWDHYWTDPQSLPSGWTVDTTGGIPDAVATYEPVGDGYAIQLVSDSDGKAMIYQVFAGLVGATTFECRFEVECMSRESSPVNVPFTLRDGARRFNIYFRTTGLGMESGAVNIPTTVVVGDWVTITLRRVDDYYYVWDGPNLVHCATYGSLVTDGTLDGEIRLGNSSTAAKTARIRRFALKIGAVNTMPPNYAMAGTEHGR